VHDFLHPDRIVIGVSSDRAKQLLLALYTPLNAPVVVTDVKSAELIKHASNAFLSTKISFINAVAQICERVGADVTKVAEGMGLDPRIGRAFLDAGPGFGGFCFPKDLDAFIHIAGKAGYDFTLLKAVRQVNVDQKRHMVSRIESALWVLSDKTIGVLGLAFKAGTDDMRYSPAIDVIQGLCEAGARVKAYDPQAMDAAGGLFDGAPVTLCPDAYAAAEGADCLVIVTDWPEFSTLDFGRVKSLLTTPVIVDGRNLLDANQLRQLGFQYVGIGRENPV
jgi:UDPglucose 6-dehydrogenase